MVLVINATIQDKTLTKTSLDCRRQLVTNIFRQYRLKIPLQLERSYKALNYPTLKNAQATPSNHLNTVDRQLTCIPTWGAGARCHGLSETSKHTYRLCLFLCDLRPKLLCCAQQLSVHCHECFMPTQSCLQDRTYCSSLKTYLDVMLSRCVFGYRWHRGCAAV